MNPLIQFFLISYICIASVMIGRCTKLDNNGSEISAIVIGSFGVLFGAVLLLAY